MCGIVGFLSAAGTESNARSVLESMADRIIHRGPDDAGYWIDKDGGYAVGQRRLSVVDLSQAGHQPMLSSSGRFVISFNGEIYNHSKIRVEIEQVFGPQKWRGHSDTETLLAGIQHWGLSATLKKCIGMFAFALWDRETKTLSLARDRMGEKPLYYGWVGSGPSRRLAFASELKAFRNLPDFNARIHEPAVALYFRFNYVPTPLSIYDGIFKLEPATIRTYSAGQTDAHIETYWSLPDVIRGSKARGYRNDPQQAVEELHSLLLDAVGQQMEADVPLGAFLSGGIDSSLIVALMQAQSSRPVKTFNIGFGESDFDESLHAAEVAKHLGTDHVMLRMDPSTALSAIPLLPQIYCEPFSDVSQIPTYLVSKLAREHVTVSLSGDAGDELFGGYNRYSMGAGSWQWLSAIPAPVRKSLGGMLASVSPDMWDRLGGTVASQRSRNFGEKIHKAADAMQCGSIWQLYFHLSSPGNDYVKWVRADNATGWEDRHAHIANLNLSDAELMMALDALTYLSDDILVKVDRASMAVSLESRVPFLDHRIIDFAWQLPENYKLRNGKTKWPLRHMLEQYVPDSLMNRPKAGFTIPLAQWLRGPLREWAADILLSPKVSVGGRWNAEQIRYAWDEHMAGKRNWSVKLWSILMFEAWANENGL